MPDYEILIHCHGRGRTHLEILYANDAAAIRAAEILAAGRSFEVWRGVTRIDGAPVPQAEPGSMHLH
jgi:hypothetical protein